MYIGTPKIVYDYINAIPHGETRTIIRLKSDLGCKNECDAMGSVSTAIFIRIAAQATLDQLSQGKTPAQVSPFWRFLTSQDKIAKKLCIDLVWLDQQRAQEKSA